MSKTKDARKNWFVFTHKDGIWFYKGNEIVQLEPGGVGFVECEVPCRYCGIPIRMEARVTFNGPRPVYVSSNRPINSDAEPAVYKSRNWLHNKCRDAYVKGITRSKSSTGPVYKFEDIPEPVPTGQEQECITKDIKGTPTDSCSIIDKMALLEMLDPKNGLTSDFVRGVLYANIFNAKGDVWIRGQGTV